MIRTPIKHARWWFYLWTIWGLVVGAIVLAIDRSAVAGLTWVAVALLAGVYGERTWEWIGSRLFAIFAFRKNPLESSWSEAIDTDTPWLAIAASQTLELVNPPALLWQIYPATCVAAGLVHGVLLGTVWGALLPVTGYPQITSFLGAGLGFALGPIFVSLLCAVIFPVVIYWQFRGPTIEPVRATVFQAVEEADHLGHEVVIPAHLLLAILLHPTGQAALFFREHEDLLSRSANYLRNQLAEQSLRLEDSLDGVGLLNVLQQAVAAAKARRQSSVGAAHLLLALLDENPQGTIDVLKKAGFAADELRPRIVASLSRTDR